MSLLAENIGRAILEFPTKKEGIKKIEKFHRKFPFILRSAHVKAVSLEKRREIIVDPKEITLEEREMLNIKIELNTGCFLLIPGMELARFDQEII